jgi:oligoendopeptidase F
MAETLKKRSEIPENLKWDTSLIFASKEEMFKKLDECMELSESIEKKYKGKLTSGKIINECLEEYAKFLEGIDHVSNYTSLNVSVDYTDADAQNTDAAATSRYMEGYSRLSFIDSEIADAPMDVIKEALDTTTIGKTYLEDVLRGKPHRLSAETEAAFISLSESFEAPYRLYEQTKLADMKFPDFEVNGVKHPLGYSLFEDNYEYEKDTDIRRAAFSAFSEKLRDYIYTTAAEYGAHVRTEKIRSKLEKFDSVFDYLLFNQKVTRKM